MYFSYLMDSKKLDSFHLNAEFSAGETSAHDNLHINDDETELTVHCYGMVPVSRCFNHSLRGLNPQIFYALMLTHFAELHTSFNLLHFLQSVLDHLLNITLDSLHLHLNVKTRI